MKGYTIQNSINLLEKGGTGSSDPTTASDVSFDKTGTSLDSTNVQSAIVELDTLIAAGYVYSSNEHKVGTWVDNSDVMEKTIDMVSNIEVPYNSWLKLTGVSIPDINLILDCKGTNQNGTHGPLLAGITGTNLDEIEIQSPRNTTAQTVRYINITYTKKPAATETKKTRRK